MRWVPAVVVNDADSQELEARDTLHLTVSDVEQDVQAVSWAPCPMD